MDYKKHKYTTRYSYLIPYLISFSFIVLLFASCNIIPKYSINTSDDSAQKGRLYIQIALDDSLTNPDGTSIIPTCYDISGTGPNGDNFNIFIDSEEAEVTNLNVGSWEIVIYAENEGTQMIGMGSANTQVMTTEVISLNILIKPMFILNSNSRGRPSIVENTLVTDQGSQMRGGAFWLYGWMPDKLEWNESDEAWAVFRENRLNLVRLVCAYRPDYDNNLSLDEYESRLDYLIDRAAREGIYVLIDYHDKPGRYTISAARDFWNRFAPRYRNCSHVFYELTNEPVSWSPADYTDQNLRDFEELWQICDSYAPDTSLVILSFAHVGTDGTTTPVEVTNRLQGIDWSKTLVGFHSYWRTSSERIRELKTLYPCINTEFSRPESDEMRAMDGYDYHGTLMELLGISWIQWDIIDRQDKVETNLPMTINDLIVSGMYWSPDDYDKI